ncbi:MAG: three-Cys-motif partner protein TcmP [Chlorobiaceae bacterium]|nr:three-Cys-motif partner protein TcmP [Chlorobiaceae bacterium]
MKKYRDSQRNLYPHSEIKVELLRIYLEKYFLVLGHSTQIKKIYVYDLFCGPGIYENEKQGSPLVILNEILKVLDKGICSEAKFECFFNDTDSERILILKDYISKSSINKKILTPVIRVKIMK